MKIALLYPPPWKIPAPGEPVDEHCGPPKSHATPYVDDSDFRTIPYGLLSLAAQAQRAGHHVGVYNASAFPWNDVRALIERLPAKVFGLTCLTSNRRGVRALAYLIKDIYPDSYIVVGGPHATALPEETLKHCKAIDSIVIGEGEETFIELLETLATGKDVLKVDGLVTRQNGAIVRTPRRKRIDNLDTLASPHDYYSSHIILTSRGCPGQCTFCDSNTMWERRVRFNSPQSVLDMLERAVRTHGHHFLAIKDDTFTVNKKRAIEICQGILERKLNFIWSCDTRVDAMDDELLKIMRLAGCRMLSFGVESGSPEILKSIKKQITPQKVLKATAQAKKYGFQVRFYMMWGNRGETLASIKQSIDLIKEAKPNQVIFTLLSAYPGTEEFEILRAEKVFSNEVFFTEDFMTLKCFLGKGEELETIKNEIKDYECAINYWDYSLEEARAIAKRLPNLHDAELDLAAACYRAKLNNEAEGHAARAVDMGHPLSGLGLNVLACTAASRGEYNNSLKLLDQAQALYPHGVVLHNKRVLTNWLNTGGPSSGEQPDLTPNAFFETVWLESQPEKSVSLNLSPP